MKVGSLVECIADFNDGNALIAVSEGVIVPIKTIIYTVRNMTLDDGIRLDEIINRNYEFSDGFDEPYFCIKCFRELLPPIENIEQKIKEQIIEIELA